MSKKNPIVVEQLSEMFGSEDKVILAVNEVSLGIYRGRNFMAVIGPLWLS